jgi:phosphate transport system substrate-binding protein
MGGLQSQRVFLDRIVFGKRPPSSPEARNRLRSPSMLVISTFAWAVCASAYGQSPASIPATTASNPTVTTSVPSAPAVSDGAAHQEHVALMHLMDAIEPYHPKAELRGTAVLAGSTTMQSMARAWSERFRKFHPEVIFTRGKDGTSAAIQEIAENPNVIAGASRPLTTDELNGLKGSHCKEPLAVIVALDPLALYVHRSNPIASVTPEQLESILRAPSAQAPTAVRWGELGLTGDWANQPIRIHSRNDLSGTTGFIQHWIVRGQELARSAEVHATNESVAAAIGKDPMGVGMLGFGEANESIRGVPLVIQGVAVEPSEQNFLAGKYSLVRPLILVIDKAAMESDGGLRESVLRYVLSRDGQMEAVRAGFFPIDPAFIRKQLDMISGPQLR